MKYRRPIILISMAVGAAALSLAQKQNDAPVDSGVIIRTGTKQVLVDAVVTDKKGEYVRNLEAKDFKVFEDGKEQPIKSFSFEADPQSPNRSQTHYLVLFFDNPSMDASDQIRARQAAVKFIDANAGPDRMIAILNYGGGPQLNFTANVERLKSVAGGTALAVTSGAETSSGPGLNITGGCGNDVIMEIRCLAKRLAAVPGRKSFVWITAGFKMTPELTSEATAAIDACNKANVAVYAIDVRGLVAGTPIAANFGGAGLRLQPPSWLAPMLALSFEPQRGGGPASGPTSAPAGGGRGGASVGASPVGAGGGPRGTGSAPGGARGTASPPSNPGPANPGRGGSIANPMNSPLPGLNPYNQARSLIPKIPESTAVNQNVMYMLADGTGGFVIHDNNDLLAGLQKIGREQNEYYLLGYTPPTSAEGSCHVLRVKVDRGAANVRFRTGYCNAKPADLLSGTPVEKQLETRAAAGAGGVPAQMQLPFFYTSANVARVNVAMEIAPEPVKFEKQKGKLHAEINVLGLANTPEGQTAARFSDTVKVEFPDTGDGKKEAEAFQKKPLHYENQFELASGKYNLTVVFSSGGSSFGKVEMPLQVDPYQPGQFAISALALSREVHKTSDLGFALDASLLEDKIPLITQGLQIVPSGTNQFKADDIKVFYAEIYEPLLTAPPDPNAPTAVAIEMRVLDRQTGQEKADTGLMRLDLGKQGSNPIIALGERIPVDKLGPGSYTLELSALDTGNNQFTRTADFELR
ncbi:MAG TPA: VWA domain-containing protein [Bryobacteraceae bacterium]|nr:VWA domain-containing protein [Bryobacteraceae bacterium]